NDLFAVYAATKTAVDRARAGLGPTLIESLTYRLGAHNTSDDPTRYFKPEALTAWKALNPILRVQRYLTVRGLWSEAIESDWENEVSDEVDRAFAAAFAVPPPAPDDLFQHTYGELTQRQLQQLRETNSHLAQPQGHD
ncbi:MAG TPA: thiamine pyrophosphate-dependent enzyme, partial [Terriglobales bacterium]|nr:thiamine pyrophosphate-dependent enzyme [Terriglobales bacterium]